MPVANYSTHLNGIGTSIFNKTFGTSSKSDGFNGNFAVLEEDLLAQTTTGIGHNSNWRRVEGEYSMEVMQDAQHFVVCGFRRVPVSRREMRRGIKFT